MGMRYLTASRAIITATFEPVVAIATAYVFLNEPFSLVQAGGGLLVISAIVTLQLWQESPPPAYETVVTRQGE
jgi:drug/metabolite transporter (DMT)-like permease